MTAAAAPALAENPLVAGLERLPIPPTTMVIFGGTGDLSRRKLLPALYNLAHEGALPERIEILAIGRRDLTDEAFRADMRAAIERFSRTRPQPEVLDALLDHAHYACGAFDDPATYREIAARADALEAAADVPFNRLFYLATPPAAFPVIVAALGPAGLHRREEGDVRLVVEKPFGGDLASARELNRCLLEVFRERQVYRIDHYLGKETVQNLLALRFANGFFEPLWNRNYIDYVQITVAEDVGIGTRAGYYDRAGALRDLVQNHMLQLLTLLCMEVPASFSAEQVRGEKVKVLHAVRPPRPQDVARIAVRGQYGPGFVAGEPVPGYLEEQGVPEASRTETFAALRLEVSNWRWAGVPFYLRTGKRLTRKLTEIAVTLKPVPHLLFEQDGAEGAQPNQLRLAVQPNEGVSLSLAAKIPGAGMRIRPVNMEFQYGTAFLSQSPEAYERLILDAMRGDATLFTRDDEVEASWAIVDPVADAWDADPRPPPTYPAGSSGPPEADALLRGAAAWRPI